MEAKLKWNLSRRPSIIQQLSSESVKQQESRRNGLLYQFAAIKFLARQGISLRGHVEKEGNVYQLLSAWKNNNDAARSWIINGKYMSHDIINELVTIMGQMVMNHVLSKIKGQNPQWYAIIGDEATDVNYTAQLNVSIRYVDDDYNISEDAIGLTNLPNTCAETIYSVIKDLLLRCALPLSLCRGQAYDGAAVMKGVRTGVATRIKNDTPQALPVHCLAHSLNLCLQDAGRQIKLLRDAIDIVREIVQLIKYSPKRKHLFAEKLFDSEGPSTGIKPLCPTRWTARTAAFEAVIKHYNVIIGTMEDININTHDEYGLKAGGILSALEKFETFFSLRLGYLLFGCAENTSKVLQAKDLSVQEAVSAVKVTQSFYKRQRQDDSFEKIFESTVTDA